MRDENKTNTLLLTVIGVATLLVAVIGATFAYFTANLNGDESSTTITVGAGTLSISYASGSGVLTAIGIVPQPEGVASITKDFTITGNNTTVSIMPYTIEIVVQSNEFSNNALSYTLSSYKTGGNGTIIPEVLTEVGIATGAGTIELGTGSFDGDVDGKTHDYTLKIYFKDTDSNQDFDKDKTFTAYVKTKVGNVYTTAP